MSALTYNGAFEAELKKIVAEKRDEVLSRLENGRSIEDYAHYRELVGYLHALRAVEDDFCDEATKKLDQR